jgi:hypothetical protein
MVGIADQVGESNGAGWIFPRRNWPKDAVLSMDCNPLQLDLGARIVEGHLKVDRQLPDGILPPRRAFVEDTHDSSLPKMLGIVHVTEDVLCSMVAQNSICDSVDDCSPPLFLPSTFVGITNNDNLRKM